ncbi:sodium-dependent transporter [Thiorhodovibrio frisius]|uniref:Transporter n=1 Tax=Thiorhodovibrio frisius TaxID=631362 RepID=H8Z5Y9_9GAMM|nr:sodium-dependent transporter [Thiorhodovibrio frisius]EIC20639.1 SNF family Na+-dependent transporter [Thiorhodovibrio frisius]WPL21388.1 Na+-dependent transporters of the SNF family protein [Thiorhodovibrio frisius]
MATSTSIHGMWSSRFAFILAASGSAVGLGNIWRFPYTAGEYGGGAFVLVYLLCVGMIGIPIMMAEVMLGRRGRQSPINTMRALAQAQAAPKVWQFVGWLGILSGFLILSFYSVVAGWTLAYMLRAGMGGFAGIDAAASSQVFSSLIADPWQLLLWHSVFMVMVALVVARGVSGGLEQAVRFLMPALFALLLVMVVYAATQSGAFVQGLEYLFRPDFAEFQGRAGEAILSAMGQAFFSLSLGMGAIMMYGSYLSSQASITQNVVIIAGMDTLVALLAGMAIFPIVLANGLAPGSGPGLIFETLPIAFGQMPGGQFFAVLFFLLLLFAAWTSAISLLEPLTAWLVENRGWQRPVAAAIGTGLIWLLGIACLLSLNLWSDITLFGKGFFDFFDYATSNVLLPIGGVLIAVFAGWVLSRQVTAAELMGGERRGYLLWRFLIRYISPVGVTIVFLNAIGLI